MAKLIDKLYNRLIEGKLVLEEGDDASAVTGDKPTVYKIGGFIDVTTMFDKVKVGDMINQGESRLYIVFYKDEDYINLLIGNGDDDNDLQIGVWQYYKENNNWLFDEDNSFNIEKSSGLYLRHLYIESGDFHWYFLTKSSVPLQLPYQSFDELNNAIRQCAISTITNEKGCLVQYDDSDNFFTEIVIDSGEIIVYPLDEFSVEEVEEIITKLA